MKAPVAEGDRGFPYKDKYGFCVGALWFGNWGLSAVDSVVAVCRIVRCVRCHDLWTASAYPLYPAGIRGGDC